MVGYSCELIGQIAKLPHIAAEVIVLASLHLWSNDRILGVRKLESEILCDQRSRLESHSAI